MAERARNHAKKGKAMKTVYVDGQHGTTGLEIIGRLEQRTDIELLTITHAQRRDPAVRERLLNEADLVFLCLPDDAARDAVALIRNPETRIIDASTAHRTASGWVYGLPEIAGQRARIAAARRIANPGCYATGFILMLRPLVEKGIVSSTYPVVTYSITGYSGGGKGMIADFQGVDPSQSQTIASRPKNLTLGHKHLPEMTAMTMLAQPPHFLPIVGNFYKGMLVFLPLMKSALCTPADGARIHAVLSEYYAGEPFIKLMPLNDESDLDGGFLSPLGCNDTNRAELFVYEQSGQILVAARFDNLGKGASGAAVQNMNIALGCDETHGLVA